MYHTFYLIFRIGLLLCSDIFYTWQELPSKCLNILSDCFGFYRIVLRNYVVVIYVVNKYFPFNNKIHS
jgi:hypothetical protein